MRPLLFLILALTVGCTEPGPAPDAFVDVLDHRGQPAAAEDWTFVPFADSGSWMGFALPPEGNTAGFTGPFLMNEGTWTGPQLARLHLGEVAVDSVRSWSVPGALMQVVAAGDLQVGLTLWFPEAGCALVQARMFNVGADPLTLDVSWRGTVFPEFALSLNPQVARVTSPGRAEIAVGSPGLTPMDVDDGYALMGDMVTIAPGGFADSIVAVTLRIKGDHSVDPTRWLADPDASWLANRERWTRYVSAVDNGRPHDDPFQILAVKSLQTLVNNWRGPAGRFEYSALFPSSNVWYFNGFWAWDSWKHAVALAVFDAEVAKDQVRAMFAHMNEQGMIADVVYLDPAEDNWRDTKPPLAGWAVEEIWRATGDLEFVREMYPQLVRYHHFWYAHRDHDQDGLCEYGSTDGTLVAARWESGMDNAVRFDATAMLENGPGAWSMDQESVDLNSYLYREKRALALFAEALGMTDHAARWTAEADTLGEAIRSTMFDEETGWFYDTDIATGEIIPVQGPEGWIPLWAGVATGEQASLVRATLLDPQKFRTHMPLPTVAADHPEFSEGYWRGLVWLDQAWFAIEGLRRYGFEDDARDLAEQLVANAKGATVKGAPLRENYHPLTGEGRNVNHFSWSAAHLLLLATSLR